MQGQYSAPEYLLSKSMAELPMDALVAAVFGQVLSSFLRLSHLCVFSLNILTKLLIAFPENMRANPSVTTCTDVSLPSGGGSGHYVVHGTGNYTDGTNMHSTPNQFTMGTPQGSSSSPTKTGFKADAEI